MVAGVRSIDVFFFFFCGSTLTDFPFLLSRLVWDRTPLNRPFRNGLWSWRATEKRTARWWINFTTTRRRFVIGCQSRSYGNAYRYRLDIVERFPQFRRVPCNNFNFCPTEILFSLRIQWEILSSTTSPRLPSASHAYPRIDSPPPPSPSSLKRFKPRSTQLPFFYHFHPVSRDYVNDDSLVSTIDEILANGTNRVIHTNLVECNSIRRKDNNYPFGSSEIVESFAN